jgi:hypothetical protein
MTKADGENSKSLQIQIQPGLHSSFSTCLAVWLSGCVWSSCLVWEWSGVEVGGASEGVWLKSPRARKALQQKGSKSEIPAKLDSEVSCARENLTTLGLLLVGTPQTKKEEASDAMKSFAKYVPRCVWGGLTLLAQ